MSNSAAEKCPSPNAPNRLAELHDRTKNFNARASAVATALRVWAERRHPILMAIGLMFAAILAAVLLICSVHTQAVLYKAF